MVQVLPGYTQLLGCVDNVTFNAIEIMSGDVKWIVVPLVDDDGDRMLRMRYRGYWVGVTGNDVDVDVWQCYGTEKKIGEYGIHGMNCYELDSVYYFREDVKAVSCAGRLPEIEDQVHNIVIPDIRKQLQQINMSPFFDDAFEKVVRYNVSEMLKKQEAFAKEFGRKMDRHEKMTKEYHYR